MISTILRIIKKESYILAVVKLVNKKVLDYDRGMDLIKEIRKIKIV